VQQKSQQNDTVTKLWQGEARTGRAAAVRAR
jgi:hypothetical protein